MEGLDVESGIAKESIRSVLEWTNERGREFLFQYAGDGWSYPLTAEQIEAEREGIYSIYRGGCFAGMIQIVKQEGDNIHVGRFLLDPTLTGRGLGTAALQKFCRMIFRERQAASITLNVLEQNAAARRCYSKCGFQEMARVCGSRGEIGLLMKRWKEV